MEVYNTFLMNVELVCLEGNKRSEDSYIDDMEMYMGGYYDLDIV